MIFGYLVFQDFILLHLAYIGCAMISVLYPNYIYKIYEFTFEELLKETTDKLHILNTVIYVKLYSWIKRFSILLYGLS